LVKLAHTTAGPRKDREGALSYRALLRSACSEALTRSSTVHPPEGYACTVVQKAARCALTRAHTRVLGPPAQKRGRHTHAEGWERGHPRRRASCAACAQRRLCACSSRRGTGVAARACRSCVGLRRRVHRIYEMYIRVSYIRDTSSVPLAAHSLTGFMRDMPMAARIAATAELIRTDSLGSVCIADGSATSVSSRHIVKPIPPSMPTTLK